MDSVKFDEEMMRRAIALGEQGRITAPPNPWVGCVIVKDGKVLGEGFHFAAGQQHAEVNALNSVIDPAGATVYITLEPCSHYGRTPPCTQALLEAKVKRVVIAQIDPDLRVRGQGVTLLRNAGIEVDVGVLAAEAEASLRPYLQQRKTGRSYCLAKAAITIDGRIAAQNGTSQWISGPEARVDAHRLRAESQAIIIGAGTAIRDNPSLTVRDFHTLPVHPPLRVLLDAKGTVPPSLPLFDMRLGHLLIVTTSSCPPEVRKTWEAANAEVVEMARTPLDILELLAKRGVIQTLVEGGSQVLGEFLRHGVIDKISVYMGPRILGDTGMPLFKNYTVETMEKAPIWVLDNVKRLGNSVRIDFLTEN